MLIEVGYKDGIFDAIGEGVKKDVDDFGARGIRAVRSLQIYRITGKITSAELDFISSQILSDPITQHVSLVRASKKEKGAHFIEIWYKRGVTDTVGESVRKAIEDVGIRGVESITTGKKFIFESTVTDKQLSDIAVKLLANTLVEDHYINENPRI